MANSSINLVNLDFDTLKGGFIEYLKTQDQFKDYNFDSSNMNVLLDILSYNTFKNAFYLNMAFAESFIDSAQLRESLFSHSKELNYVPRSARSSSANVTVTFLATGESQPYTIRKGQTFSTIVKQDSYTFSADEDIVLTSANTQFSATFEIFEGIYTTDSYIMDHSQAKQGFPITNQNVDTNSLVVLVYEDKSTVAKKYKRATTLLDLTESSQVYFLQASSSGSYEVIFGDGVIGKRPKNGSTIVLDYRTTVGKDANGARSFTANFDPTNSAELLSSVNVTTNKFSENTPGAYSINGDSAETNDSIRYYAPRHFQTQERAVTESDYEIILKTQFPEIGAVSVYGGEEEDPPRYGKVFIALDIKNVEGIPDSKKIEYYNFIKSRSPLSIDPIFTEPDRTYVSVKGSVSYNINKTTRKPKNMLAACTLAIMEYSDKYLNDFKAKLRYSKLVKQIDDVDPSIVGNQIDLRIYKKFLPRLGTPQDIEFSFRMPLEQTYYVLDTVSTLKKTHNVEDVHIISSSLFTFRGEKCMIEDNGNGVLRIIKAEDDNHKIMKNIGRVNYENGKIKLNNFNPDSYEGNFFKIYAKPRQKDIIGRQKYILAIESDEINLDVKVVRE